MRNSVADYIDIHTIKDFFTSRNGLYIPTGNLGIPRDRMPQIVDFNKFEKIMKSMEISISTTRVRIGSLKLAQNEVNKDKVYKMMLDYRIKNKRSRGSVNFPGFPPVITVDGYVLDGLHRQVAMVNVNKHAYHDYTQIDMTFKGLYKLITNEPSKFFGVVEYKRL